MANVCISVDYPIEDGMNLTFTAPCNCSAVTGLKVTYPVVTETDSTSTSKTFAFKDAHNNNLSSTNNLFVQGAIIKVILDVTNGYAYIQNADTNAYLEGKFSNFSNDISTLNTGLSNTNNNISDINTTIATINSKINELWYKPDDTISFTTIWIAGIISNAGRCFEGWIPVAKPIRNDVTDATFSYDDNSTITLRSVEGYIFNKKDINTFTNDNSIQFTPYLNGLKVRIDFSEAQINTANNNTPATLTFYKMYLGLS